MAFNFKNISILVVNETPSTLKMITTILQILQFKEIDGAQDINHAFMLFREKGHNVVITEMDVAGMNGIQFASKIRGKDSGSPRRDAHIILTTGNHATLDINAIRDGGFTELLLVPFAVDDIANRIAYVLENPREFIETGTFVGPDRRRKADPNFKGPFKRQDDAERGLGNG